MTQWKSQNLKNWSTYWWLHYHRTETSPQTSDCGATIGICLFSVFWISVLKYFHPQINLPLVDKNRTLIGQRSLPKHYGKQNRTTVRATIAPESLLEPSRRSASIHLNDASYSDSYSYNSKPHLVITQNKIMNLKTSIIYKIQDRLLFTFQKSK